MSGTGGPLVVVTVGTRHRPDGLRRLVESLGAQEGCDGFRTVVVVVDNDPKGGARAAATSPSPAWPLTYLVEPEGGIPAVRRSGVRQALAAGADAIVFVDDDEVAPPTWLATLVGHWQSSGADVVTGPMLRRLPPGAPRWARSADHFDTRGNHRTGASLEKAYTGNALVSRRVFDALDIWFDDAFRYTGSSDLHFFLKVRRAGLSIQWCDEAVVVEHVPSTRLTWRWYVARGYRSGIGDTVARRLISPGWRSTLECVVRGVGRIGYGLLVAPFGLVRPAYRSLAARRIASGAGSLAGLWGARYEEYRRRDSV